MRKSKYKTEIQTNMGTGEATEEGDVPDFRSVMFSDKAIANSLVENELCAWYHVMFDSEKENAFNVTLNDGRIMKFACDEDGMYAFSPGENIRKESQHMKKNIGHHDEMLHLDSVSGRIKRIYIEELGPSVRQARGNSRKSGKEIYVKGYMRRKVDHAIRARRLYYSLTAPDLQEVKSFLCQNIMRNCPVTTEDVILAERIFGKDIPTLKGKSTMS